MNSVLTIALIAGCAAWLYWSVPRAHRLGKRTYLWLKAKMRSREDGTL